MPWTHDSCKEIAGEHLQTYIIAMQVDSFQRANSIGVAMNNAGLTSAAWASEPTNGWAWRRLTVADSTLIQGSLPGLGVKSTPLRSIYHDRGACVMSAAPAIRTLKFTKYLV
ncbi:uncharacterized protein PGTG_11184 [Puccinia graminis f. sp. tritici CRL 75-36-700-3]|uniref:Uncharacterized protein n=1 Tax=Puccinia graminis f. sp. tritici (strain CRL 75-36-700-3 / race SCCL) TaxID=418459 RepID=E3KL40_PUCGT|nr:uncharacterized protein PGTG_11184 [Puccinia graminis f. sp. tritici CRL 75-36-700-3]EFP85015.1 hypothetical protein PGTG_11184 [Puccinia graminis f. sp. tritici CRL 75-36-700-3]